MADVNYPTYMQDWQARLLRLKTSSGPQGRQFFELQQRVLASLLEKHRGTPVALQRTRFPVPPEPFSDRRGVMLFHHLAKGEVSGVKSEEEATRRASTILQRMKKLDLQGAAQTYSKTGEVQRPYDPARAPNPKTAIGPATNYRQSQLWWDAQESITALGFKMHNPLVMDRADQSLAISPQLPEKVGLYLLSQIHNPDAQELLRRCESPHVLENAVVVWRQRMMGKRPGPVRLRAFLTDEKRRVLLSARLRLEILTSDLPKVRLNAIRLLGGCGSLDDIGLFSDMLGLPRFKYEDARERPSMVRAMRRIATALLNTAIGNPAAATT